MDIKELESEYQNFYAPTFEILVEGQNILQLGVEVTNVNIDNTLDGANTFAFTVLNAFDPINRELQSFVQNTLVFDAEVEIKFGYSSKIKTIMFGIITAIKLDFPSGGAPQIDVSGFDISYRMMKEKKPRSWNKKKDSEVVKEIADNYKLDTSFDDESPFSKVENTIDETDTEYEQIIKQEKENDFEFLRRLAERNHYDFFIFNKTLCFRKPADKEDPIVTLVWQQSLVSFSPDIDIAERVVQVKVMGQQTDTDEKKEIVATARILNYEIIVIFFKKILAAISGEEITEQLTTEQVKHPVSSEKHAETLAKSILLKRHENIFTGSGESIGIPDILAGTNIKLEGLGKKFSQKYYVTQTNHSISSSGYKTTFNVKILPNQDQIDVTSTTTLLSSGEKKTEPDQNQGATEEIIPDPMIR